ncbi:putative ankyrin repeat protein [Phytophthora citrophthora]|uniref:Ankyrin repeat protein n=1 Tax=Phytophthora citrophthora TaxID=4793 RepID=A0AAD9LNX3_9STRA|nr:putative ankyrin repeat protein [Phytophthora citrophthora]
MDEAAANGQLTVVKYMAQHAVSLRCDTKYSFWPPVDTLSKAILGGHTDVAEFLVNESRILWNLKNAYATAVEQGQTALARRICEVYPEQVRGRSLFLDLASWGHLEAVKYLYKNGCDDSGLVGKAFAAAAGDAQRDVVKFLVGTGRVNSEAFDKAFKRACYGFKTIDTMTFLYNLKRASPQGINRGFESSNDVAVMKLFYEKEKISDKAIATAFTNALDLRLIGDSSVIRYLSKKPGISSELIGTAFVSAALRLNTDVVNFLKDNERLSSVIQGHGTSIRGSCQTSQSGHDEITVR